MAVFLLVLKIIGITVLSIIGLLLLVLCLVLFVPVRYKAFSSKETDEAPFRAAAGASWLLSIVSAVYDTQDKNGLTIRVFGIRLKSREERDRKKAEREAKRNCRRKAEKKKDKYKEDKKEKDYIPGFTIYEYDDQNDDVREVSRIEKWPDIHDTYQKKKDNDKEEAEIEEEDDAFKVIEEKISAILNKLSGIKERIFRVVEKTGDIASDIDYYHNALSNDARNRQALEYIFKKAKRLLKSVAPRKVDGRLDYGSEDPSDTGRVLAIASMLYPLYGTSIRVVPDFENKHLSFDLKLKGRVYINVVAVVLLQLYFNKKVRRFIHIMKKENDNGK